jgi:hypothetical protein
MAACQDFVLFVNKIRDIARFFAGVPNEAGTASPAGLQ